MGFQPAGMVSCSILFFNFISGLGYQQALIVITAKLIKLG
ncbi:putative membrane protein [Lyngbya aestuarii BL J]|uniref:Putative membrane protein n=1 Tax=Lyngbya aestuarii BL J TaxID=1348334 RepID=U7QRN2_9CYAN|nr:putative membrane protein [Lyngbya aestuarii BL J]